MQPSFMNPAHPWVDLLLPPAPVVLVPGERWCANCGETLVHEEVCPRCAGTACIDPRLILRPGEYMVDHPGRPERALRPAG